MVAIGTDGDQITERRLYGVGKTSERDNVMRFSECFSDVPIHFTKRHFTYLTAIIIPPLTLLS
jgi:hypothetical protein